MKKDLVNVSGHNFTKLGDNLDMNSIAWNFWNFIRGTGSTEEEAADNLEVVGAALKDKFGEVFSLHELEDWIASQENKVENIIQALQLEITESEEADESDEYDESDEDDDSEADDEEVEEDDIDGCGAPSKKKVNEEFYYSEDEDDWN